MIFGGFGSSLAIEPGIGAVWIDPPLTPHPVSRKGVASARKTNPDKQGDKTWHP